ncbi:MAG TPA: hypothetical protein GX714_14195 [Chloroflexi bacterium]|jgi:hypothetical protein|nr:hypothetical protein [Chloroflexota bacterium]
MTGKPSNVAAAIEILLQELALEIADIREAAAEDVRRGADEEAKAGMDKARSLEELLEQFGSLGRRTCALLKDSAPTERVPIPSRGRRSPSVTFQGQVYPARTATAAMLQAMRLLAQYYPGFLDRFAMEKHGKKRRYVATDRFALYPGRPDLAETASVQIVPGWWLSTNHDRGTMKKIVRMACQSAGVAFGRDLIIDLG